MNKELLKNKTVIIAAGIVVLLLVFVAAFFLNQKNANQTQNTSAIPTEIPIPSIAADSIGLTLASGSGGKTVIASLSNVEGISSIDYELSYLSKGDIPRGALGLFNLTKKPIKEEITLGTCSDTCHYDEGVSNIKIILKITKTDGKVYQAEQALTSVTE